ncbi:MAG: hypothetical protein C0483_10110 [Pirellula sp.]|nr:hypothetical protein [Pirellula sp.]
MDCGFPPPGDRGLIRFTPVNHKTHGNPGGFRTSSDEMKPTTKSSATVFASCEGIINGQLAVTQRVVAELKKHCTVRILGFRNSTGATGTAGILWNRLLKACSVIQCVTRLAFTRKASKTLYVPLDGGKGLGLNLLAVAVAKLRGYSVVLHHHSYRYVEERCKYMAALARLSGPSDYHVVPCCSFGRELSEQYRKKLNCIVVPASVASIGEAVSAGSKLAGGVRKPLTIGHMSNLSLEKGLGRVVETFELMLQQSIAARLVIAGPYCTDRERELVEGCVNRHSEYVDYRGRVSGPDKAKFFQDIDIFLFPSKYKDECWGIVLNEALAYGCPVIAYDRACIAHVIGKGAGSAIPASEDFPRSATALIQSWLGDPTSYAASRNAAIKRSEELMRESELSLSSLVSVLQTPAAPPISLTR